MAKRMTGRQLDERLDALGFSQIGFAEAIGVNPRTVRHWVAGSYPVPKIVEINIVMMTEFDVNADRLGKILMRRK